MSYIACIWLKKEEKKLIAANGDKTNGKYKLCIYYDSIDSRVEEGKSVIDSLATIEVFVCVYADDALML